ncbi:16S rRNA (uracil(1498)-N(3))-methyltransferase [Pseudoclavibacter sp. AY1F1]|uniref:16S rRNA (uracil(1498)-N(3))-methyltransferase n=1 Tax=Pseudoclavibacter sp. AY1F1 TaxID=2080583 RepID=UPI000CE83F12|nr:16S rRNA (uracil(1498)-N(3))-methyltransferase [Pseudoclavibacter sp. AY1F1]PPF47154.1 16S rRNA (uracil(1498)-N(3))-methyltransferase [Pseudoclavibacter sp. AY1F1]
MAWLYLAEDLDEALRVGDVTEVRGGEAKHMGVARMRVGERVQLGNGRGYVVDGELLALERDRAVVSVLGARRLPEPEPRVTVVQALAKGGRDDLAVQVATELGASAFVPWQAKRSVSRWDQKADKGRERWASVAREASKQSLSPWVPEVAQLHSTAQVARLAANGPMLVLDPVGDTSLREALGAGLAPNHGGLTLVVGPEGGIDGSEFAQFEAVGARRVHLGASVLRTSSAAPAAIAAILALSGSWDSRFRDGAES